MVHMKVLPFEHMAAAVLLQLLVRQRSGVDQCVLYDVLGRDVAFAREV